MTPLLRKPMLLIELLLVVLLGAIITWLSMTHVSDPDFWWHLRLGQAVAQTGNIDGADSLTFTFRGMPQINSEWLGDLILYGVFSAGGYVGANLFKAVVILAMCLFLLAAFRETRTSDQDRSWFVAGVLTLLVVVFALRFRLFVRPFLFSYLLVAVFLYLLHRLDRRSQVWILVALPLLTILWANLSKGAFLGPVIVSVYAVDQLLKRRLTLRLILTTAAVWAATLVCPDSIRVYALTAQMVLGDPQQQELVLHVGEHQPLSPELLWGQGLRYTLGYQLLVGGAALYLVLLRGWRRPFHIGLFLAFLVPSALVIRMTSFFSIIGAVLAFWTVHRALRLLPARLRDHRGRLAAVGAGVVCLVGVLLAPSATFPLGTGPKPHTFSTGALKFLDHAGVSGRMFNSYPLGGFIAWHAPQRRIFIDGRGGQLFGAEFYAAYFAMIKDPAAWKKAQARWKLDIAVLDYDVRFGGNRHFAFHLNDNPDWGLVYWDRSSAVYLRRTSANKPILDRFAYRMARPTGNDFSYLDRIGRTPAVLGQAARDLAADIARDPNNQEPRLARAYLLLNYGSQRGKQLGFKELLSCLTLPPDIAMEHAAAAAMFLRLGQRQRAQAEVGRALALEPGNHLARSIQAQLRGEPPPPPPPAGAAVPPGHP